MKGWALLLAFAAAPLLIADAHADSPATTWPATVSPRRPLPLYGGRVPGHGRLGDDLLVVPRVILAPAYLVSEYAIRRPLSVVIPAAEKADLFTKTYDFFVFGANHKAGIVPVGFADFDFNPSLGIYAFWNDAGFGGDDLSLHAEAWPDDWFAASAIQRVREGEDRTLQLRVAELHRPDRVFYGIGPNTLQSDQSRYGLQRVSGDASYEWRFWRSSRVETSVGVRDVNVFDGHYGSDPSLTREATAGAFPVPYGFGRPYTAQYNRLVAAVDTRKTESRRGSGVRLELDAEQGSDVRNVPGSGWLRYGATASGTIDMTGTRRVVGLTLTTQFVDPLGSRPVPFTELVYLGGDHAMRGFFLGRLLGRSATVATVTYRWPIGPWLDADLQLALGNVFGEHLAGFDAGLLRFSGAFGVSIGGLQSKAVMGSQDAPIEILIGIGSETFDARGLVDTVRFMAGVPLAF
jgi:hypothetical protein